MQPIIFGIEELVANVSPVEGIIQEPNVRVAVFIHDFLDDELGEGAVPGRSVESSLRDGRRLGSSNLHEKSVKITGNMLESATEHTIRWSHCLSEIELL